jgi:hypothetical protein
MGWRTVVAGVALLGVAGCSSGGPGAVVRPSARPTSTAPAAPALYGQAELAGHPCSALDARDRAALRITAPGTDDSGPGGPGCGWELPGQHVTLIVDVPRSYEQTMTQDGLITQVPVGSRPGVQAEFQRICFVFVPVTGEDHLVATTAIPDPGAPQDGACPAAVAVAAATTAHLR